MVYIVVKQPPMYHQMTLEELFMVSDDEYKEVCIRSDATCTKTYRREQVSDLMKSKFGKNTDCLIESLALFNDKYSDLMSADRHSLYRSFKIPKKSGGFRQIDAPEDELMSALTELKGLFERLFVVRGGALYHTSAFAYIKGRNTIDCVKRHQSNESKWFCKLDLSNFFGSTTIEFVEKMFSLVYPFSEVIADERGREEFRKAIGLAFLDGGLPQGTPISPLITNIMMIPIDFELANGLRNFEKNTFVYTRYADDFIISSKFDFDFKKVEAYLIDTFNKYGAPFTLNTKKTRYGSSSGSNWNLGVMLNKDNEITVGYKTKKRFKAALASYVMDRNNGTPWSLGDLQTLNGNYSYYRSVEKENIDTLVYNVNKKFGVDVISMMREDIRNACTCNV